MEEYLDILRGLRTGPGAEGRVIELLAILNRSTELAADVARVREIVAAEALVTLQPEREQAYQAARIEFQRRLAAVKEAERTLDATRAACDASYGAQTTALSALSESQNARRKVLCGDDWREALARGVSEEDVRSARTRRSVAKASEPE
jgi:hypothetical protein